MRKGDESLRLGKDGPAQSGSGGKRDRKRRATPRRGSVRSCSAIDQLKREIESSPRSKRPGIQLVLGDIACDVGISTPGLRGLFSPDSETRIRRAIDR